MEKQTSLTTTIHRQLLTTTLLDQLSGIYYTMNLQSCALLLCSKGSLALLGIEQGELIAAEDGLTSRIHPEDLLHFKNRPATTSSLTTLKYRIRNRQGEYVWVVDEFICMANEQGMVLCEGHIREIVQSPMKLQLLEQLKAYRDAVDVNIISSITDTEGTIIYVNKNFCDISKYSQEELIGKNHRIVCSGHHPKSFFAEMWNTIRSGKAWHNEIMNRAKDGTRYWVDTVIIPVFNEVQQVSHYLSLRFLITGRKEAEQQKNNYIRVLEEIAFIVAHKIRGPICSMAGLVNVIEHPDGDGRIDPQALEYLRLSMTDLDTITRELSDYLHTKEIDLKRRSYVDKMDSRK